MNEIYVCSGEEFDEFSCVAVVEKMMEKDVIFKRYIAFGKLLMQGRRQSFLVLPKQIFFEYYHKATDHELNEIERRGYLHVEIH